jgi:hypothetical protein
MDDPSFRETTRGHLRRLFNEARMWERAQYGDLNYGVVESSHPSAPLAGEP